MSKKIIWFITSLLIVGCSSSKPIVRTTKSPESKTVVRNVKRPIAKPTEGISGSTTSPKTTTATNSSDNSSVVLEATTRVKVTPEIVMAYIDKYKQIAKDNMVKNGIPSSITLGQAILESGAGTGPLSVQANNHFGIKCHKEWTGPSIKYDDDAAQECFRKYDDPSDSFRDHSFFLTSRTRYAALFQLDKSDYKAWAKGLKEAGYATDPKYPEKLIGLIERYQLNKYDAEVLGVDYVPAEVKTPVIVKEEKDPLIVTADSDLHYVVKGDTLYSISKKYNLTVEELKRKNNLTDNSISLGQSLIVK